MELIFIGYHFYTESGTEMGLIYTSLGMRSDWGMVERALRAGKTVTIRPATPAELRSYEDKLAEIKKKNKERMENAKKHCCNAALFEVVSFEKV